MEEQGEDEGMDAEEGRNEFVGKYTTPVGLSVSDFVFLKVCFQGNAIDLRRMRMSKKWQSPTFVF